MAKLEKAGFKRYWEMRELMGHDSNGNRVTREVFRDMQTGQTYVPTDPKTGEFRGWNGEPVGAKPDQPVFSANDKYRSGYELIHWEA